MYKMHKFHMALSRLPAPSLPYEAVVVFESPRVLGMLKAWDKFVMEYDYPLVI